jgi:hypothetical protein
MHGFLRTPEAKILHNELIRSILYNAHFAMTPPNGVRPQPPEYPPHIAKVAPPQTPGRGASFVTYTASDLRHLPSIAQLSERIGILLASKKIRVESKATAMIFNQLKKYILSLLENGVGLVTVRGTSSPRRVVLTTSQILHVLTVRGDLATTVSPGLISRYSGV